MHAHTPLAPGSSSRRDFFRSLWHTSLGGASLLELAYHRAAWARAAVPTSSGNLFDIEMVSEGVYLAKARAQATINCNAAIFVRAQDVLVVDTHSRPTAASALVQQIGKEVTTKPVRYVVNTHFHGDHAQGNQAYSKTGQPVEIIASTTTKRLLSEMAEKRVKQSLAYVPAEVDSLRARASKASSVAEKEFCAEQIRQLQAYRAELQNYHLELPTITFDSSYALKDKAGDLHVEFHGHAHTAGDVFVFSPQRRALATGDVVMGLVPNLGDGYPRAWPKAIDSVAALDFRNILPGHGPVQRDRLRMTNQRNYIEELTDLVLRGREAGKSVAEVQATVTPNTLKSMQADGYAGYIAANNARFVADLEGGDALLAGLKSNIADAYRNLDRV